MRSRDLVIIVVSLLIAAGLIVVSGQRLPYINAQRKQMNLIVNEPLENAPPSLAFATVAMGAFRGLVVDILWMRAERLKDEGQFFDAKQLAEWITALQPRFAAVWDFQSWNMAYNISVAIPASRPEERWRWVKNGYELLRDKGIKLNPKSIMLYHRLAFIFQHKIGGVSDDAHKYYKLQLALAMEPLLGPADNQYFEALAKAPQTWEQITSEEDIKQFVRKLSSADTTFASADESSFVSSYLALRQNPTRFDPNAFELIDRYRGTETLKKFDIFARAYQLRNSWKLDPALMLELNHEYGPVDWDDPNKHYPLDWRHPDSHAIYWAIKGLRVAGKKGVKKPGKKHYSIDEINTDRMVIHSLQDLFRNGKIYIYTSPKSSQNSKQQGQPQQTIFYRPDLRMFVPYDKHIQKIIKKYADPNSKEPSSHQIGHRNMLKNAVLSFYQAGHIKQAQRIYDELRKLYPRPEFNVPLAVYVRNRFIDELKALDIFNAKELVLMLLRESYFRYAMRDDDEAFSRENLAKQVYDFYNEQTEESVRINLPELPRLRYMALQDFLSDQQFPPALRQSLLARIRIERPKLYEQLKQQQEQLKKELEQKQFQG